MGRKKLTVCLAVWLAAAAGCAGPAVRRGAVDLAARDNPSAAVSPVLFGLPRPGLHSPPLVFRRPFQFDWPWFGPWRVRLAGLHFHWRRFGGGPADSGTAECVQCGPRRLCAFLGKVPLLDRLWLWEAAWRCSNKALRRYQRGCGQKVSKDFKAGFRRAYWDILRGGRGQVPPVPPKKYWSAFYRSPLGRGRAEQWLEGYRVGADFARADGLDRFGRVVAAASAGVSLPESAVVDPSDPTVSWPDSASASFPDAVGDVGVVEGEAWGWSQGTTVWPAWPSPPAASGGVPPSPAPPPNPAPPPSPPPVGSGQPGSVSSGGGAAPARGAQVPSAASSSFSQTAPSASAAGYWTPAAPSGWPATGVANPYARPTWGPSSGAGAARLGWSRPF